MKRIAPFTLLMMLLTSNAAYSVTKIDSKDAPFYDGKDVIACGVLKEVSKFKKGLYLNMDNLYPKQSVTFVIWNDDLADFKKEHGNIELLIDSGVCGKGTVSVYKGRSQIVLYNAFSLQVVGR
ncbi:MAG: hypothetical protein GY951_17670 [Psychromonas sp.]|nr:hypothetical protein [Psychromonas sp.]